MFHVLIEESLNGKTVKRLDIRRMKTEKLYELLGRYQLKFEHHVDSYNQQGYREIEYTDRSTSGKALKTTVSFWRFADAKSKESIEVVPKQTNNRWPNIPQPPVKPEEPKEERIQVMFDAGVITKSYY
jgi:hypothetical protein